MRLLQNPDGLQGKVTQYGGKKTGQTAFNGCEYRFLFGKRLAEVRKMNHETQSDLGKIIGTGKSTISEMEHGVKTTTAEKVTLICKHYKVSADCLLRMSGAAMPD